MEPGQLTDRIVATVIRAAYSGDAARTAFRAGGTAYRPVIQGTDGRSSLFTGTRHPCLGRASVSIHGHLSREEREISATLRQPSSLLRLKQINELPKASLGLGEPWRDSQRLLCCPA